MILRFKEVFPIIRKKLFAYACCCFTFIPMFLSSFFRKFPTHKFLCIALAFVGFAVAQKAALKAEVEALLVQVENMEAAYWQRQESAIRDREEVQGAIEILNEKLARAYEKRNALTEEVFLVTENLLAEEASLETEEASGEGLLAGMREAVEKSSANLSSAFPSVVARSITLISEINTQVSAIQVEMLVEDIIAYKLNLLAEGSANEVYETQMQLGETEAVGVNVLRLGFAQALYLGPNGETGVLLRTPGIGGVTYAWKSSLPEDLSISVAETMLLVLGTKFSGKERVLAPVDVTQAGERTRSILSQKGGSFAKRAVAFFESGGIIMYPLTVLALLAVLIAIERSWFYFRYRTRNFATSDFIASVKSYNKTKAEEVAKKAGGFYFSALLDPFFLHKDKAMEETERLLDEKIAHITQRLETRLSTLAILGTVAPLLGLLGTVSGMITLFDVITIYGTSNPKVLAGGISIALITTQAGLGIAIPILLVHHFLRQHKNSKLDKLENACISVLEAVSGVGATKE